MSDFIERCCNIHPKALEFCNAVSNHEWWTVIKFLLLGALVAGVYFLTKWLKDTKKWTTWLGRSEDVTSKKDK